MRSEKESRVSRAKDLRARDQHLCDVLCATPFYIPSGAVASQDQLRALEEHIRNLEKEKVSIGSHDDYLQALYVLIVIAQLYFVFCVCACCRRDDVSSSRTQKPTSPSTWTTWSSVPTRRSSVTFSATPKTHSSSTTTTSNH